MDTDKAYLLGLIVGGGIFGNAEDVFRIRLPYKKWGSYLANPQRAGQISSDILNKVGQMFRAIYGITVQYETSPSGVWTILCEGDVSAIKDDLSKYNIPCEGEIRGSADIEELVKDFDDNLKRRFVAGLADTIGSMAKSQRRFTDEHQILSFEIKGYNFKFVCDLCKLLYSINCIPDQVNWNHPNIHCTSSPYYKQWNKGFKLRILLDQYAKFGAFAFRTKAETSIKNRQLQREIHQAQNCEEREIHVTPSTVHPAENDPKLPDSIRGGHYIHFRHFCAVLGCEHAPYGEICSSFKHLGEYINPFPILYKDSLSSIRNIINADELLKKREYTHSVVNISSLLEVYNSDSNSLLYGSNAENGYPISEILKAVAYIIAADNELSGKRTRSYIPLIKKHMDNDSGISIEVWKPDLLTPLVVASNGKGALIGARNPRVYEKLLSVSPKNKYKIIVRRITEGDLTDAE